MMFIRRIFRDFSLHYFEKARHPSTRKTNSMILLSLSYSFLSFEKSNELLSNMRRKEEEEEKNPEKKQSNGDDSTSYGPNFPS
jgi:hypothetical protein